MGWIDFKYDGIRLRIDTDNCLLLQKWREYITKPDDWEECNIYRKGRNNYVNVGGEQELVERVVYKAHNPEWKTHYSRHNIIMYISDDNQDFSIQNLMIKPTEGVRRY
tara:strand:- start:237 stop:560 length:324 start_codon:yes stop_codon:yes gene_type:complete